MFRSNIGEVVSLVDIIVITNNRVVDDRSCAIVVDDGICIDISDSHILVVIHIVEIVLGADLLKRHPE
jgi:hypothetical protein